MWLLILTFLTGILIGYKFQKFRNNKAEYYKQQLNTAMVFANRFKQQRDELYEKYE